ncbi:cytidine deaminase [Sediminibacterium sp.]|jgi:cytidine deaminase|uniref:cytidine deaminase n=1 Tax=Sediminibacterium sp. TaxID=1917865 RepID=UPI0025F870F2|nr:cytidine deaminase [Sediminibacterium sp.]MBW0178048.1 cytidine deaminase [Sediminibacterium sp.]
MNHQQYQFEFEVYESADQLNEHDAALLSQAKQATAMAYAPYSHFKVGAVAVLSNGQVITGTNQENASFPVGICAERVLLSNAAIRYPQVPIESLAISYDNTRGDSNHPISPCGICRQSLLEYELRVQKPIRLILGGLSGKIYIVPKASSLLPLSFTGADMQ